MTHLLQLAAGLAVAWVLAQVIVLLAFRLLIRFNRNRYDP